MRTIHPVPVCELVDLKKLTSTIQDAKRDKINGTRSRWPDRMTEEFAQLEELSVDIPYATLDLEYLRDLSQTTEVSATSSRTTRSSLQHVTLQEDQPANQSSPLSSS